jgi:hypothetical protein
VLGRQLRRAVLMLATTAVVSFFLGDSTQAIIIGAILAASIGAYIGSFLSRLVNVMRDCSAGQSI